MEWTSGVRWDRWGGTGGLSRTGGARWNRWGRTGGV